ncbi:glycogen synthase GlgA [Oceanispirochaeta crateris]|uniref:Glycogen synthase n=1 Tax=Oceanispirochaeta crateris TaxID=2518645 RepID=A0A5C1QI48_9SPIO|nr:glycogen synthase GlgA [Oceanispirochaeta crateris]QEN07197.1 glycogen synthase GlgA [Oceanispirochaeta crateris]
MKILMMTSETVPFAKSGGLADMVSALSLSLNEQSVDVRILLPLYGFIDSKDFDFLGSLQIDMVNRFETADLYRSTLEDSTIPVYFLDNNKYFNRKGIYGPTPSSSYPDNAQRYSLLCKSFIEVCTFLDWIPDVIHSHDWPCGLASVFLKKAAQKFSNCSSVFSIHNMGYQGCYLKQDLPWIGLTPEETKTYNMICDNQINFLKTAIENNDHITTVSPGYAREIQTLAYGHGMDQSLSHRKNDLTGIINGVDYQSWDPVNDALIAPDNFSILDLEGKKNCKSRLQILMGLEENPKTPLFAMITRLVEQKGIEELCKPNYGILEDFCKDQDVQVVILGTGEPWCEEELTRLSRILPNLAVKITYNEKMSHLIEAGSDFFLMPSRYEPCGLNQLYSLKYGSIPVVRRTGGLADTVSDPQDEGWDSATGFVFEKADPSDFGLALNRAVNCWKDHPELIHKMQKNGMNKDFSWTPSALSYMKIYEELRTPLNREIPQKD